MNGFVLPFEASQVLPVFQEIGCLSRAQKTLGGEGWAKGMAVRVRGHTWCFMRQGSGEGVCVA